MNCNKCEIKIDSLKESRIYLNGAFSFCGSCDFLGQEIFQAMLDISTKKFIQPERSKREEPHECGVRCSEHCGNTVSPK